MDLIVRGNLRAPQSPSLISGVPLASHFNSRFPSRNSSPQFIPTSSLIFLALARKRKSESEPVLKPTIVEEVTEDYEDGEDDFLLEEFEDDSFEESIDEDDEYYEIEDSQLGVGDGGGGGGISLAGTCWDRKALAIAEEVATSFDGELSLYAFRTLLNCTIQVRIEKLSNKSGSPSMEDIEAFSLAYRERLDEAELAKLVPENLFLEVSSPGVERVVRIPHDLDRFKHRPMYVKYVSDVSTTSSPSEVDGVFRLISFDMEKECCTWGLADVRVNREKAGKGRPLSKKQREWRLDTRFESLLLVRLYSEI